MALLSQPGNSSRKFGTVSTFGPELLISLFHQGGIVSLNKRSTQWRPWGKEFSEPQCMHVSRLAAAGADLRLDSYSEPQKEAEQGARTTWWLTEERVYICYANGNFAWQISLMLIHSVFSLCFYSFFTWLFRSFVSIPVRQDACSGFLRFCGASRCLH